MGTMLFKSGTGGFEIRGHLEKSGVIPLRHLQEFRLQSVDGFDINQKLMLEELFKEGDLVDVSGSTIGKGFQGGIKGHNFKRGLMTHGSKSHRALGSIGAGTTPGRVYKGKKMPSRMGGTKTKIRKLKIVKIDSELRIVMIKGAVPGKPWKPHSNNSSEDRWQEYPQELVGFSHLFFDYYLLPRRFFLTLNT